MAKAVDDVSFHINRGETLGLVGESGCGKTTIGRTMLRLIPATSGDITFAGRSVIQMPAEVLERPDGTCKSYFKILSARSIRG